MINWTATGCALETAGACLTPSNPKIGWVIIGILAIIMAKFLFWPKVVVKNRYIYK